MNEASGKQSSRRLHLFEGFGVELEYMLASQSTLDVFPAADQLIEAEYGSIQSEIQVGDLAWSNELALHVIELKTPTPVPSLTGLSNRFQQQVQRIDGHLSALKACLLPSAMHPWMDPDREMKLWEHEYSEVYEAFNRIFDCRGHGWANLQSVHLNLPFSGDDEFSRLHAAIRLILPLLPGIAASSPFKDGKSTGMMDTRLEVYRTNSRRVPSVCGKVIPEPAFSEEEYRRLIFEPMFAEIAPLDPDGVLQDEFLNARGAIARFGRGSIEIRVIDIQECPAADLAVLQLCVSALRALVAEQYSSLQQQQQVGVDMLHQILLSAIRDADQTMIRNADYLRLFGYTTADTCSIADLWRHLAESTSPETDAATGPALDLILRKGPLARRMVDRTRTDVDRESLTAVYRELAECLAEGTLFE